MTKKEYTPGPWTIKEHYCPCYNRNGDEVVGYDLVGPASLGDMECSAFTLPDARLIAAAPDLLEVLKSITEAMATKGYQEWWSGWDGCRQKAELAIAKAEGRTKMMTLNTWWYLGGVGIGLVVGFFVGVWVQRWWQG